MELEILIRETFIKCRIYQSSKAYLRECPTGRVMSTNADSSRGSKVVSIVGLKSKSELNGERGVVQEYLSNGRLKICLNGSATVISVKRENVVYDEIEEPADAQTIIHSSAMNVN